MATTTTMESVARLRTALLDALNGRGLPHGEQQLFDDLIFHKSRLGQLFDVGAPNPTEQRELQSGTTIVDGKPLAVNADFARHAQFLAQHLECAERYAAGLLHATTAKHPSRPPAEAIDAAVASFHARRRALADSLRLLLDAAEAAGPDAPPLCAHLNAFVRSDLFAIAPDLPRRILTTLSSLDSALARANAARASAASNTVAPETGVLALGADILAARADSLTYERRALAASLATFARLGLLLPSEVRALVEWLATHSAHALTYYVLTAVLTALGLADPASPAGAAQERLAHDTALRTFMTSQLGPTATWSDTGIKAAVLLAWTLFLTAARHRDPTLEARDAFRADALETQVWNAVQGGAFAFLATAVLRLQRRRGGTPPPTPALPLPSDPELPLRDLPANDFVPAFLRACEALVRALITHASSELRKIKQRQEDLILAGVRVERNRTASARHAPDAERPQPRNDIAVLYTLIGLLYAALPPESAVQFWSAFPTSGRMTYAEQEEARIGRLPTFLQWAVWSTPGHDPEMSAAMYGMLAGLSNGQQCSELAYNLMIGSGAVIPGTLPTGGAPVSWGALFALLESWAAPRVQPPPQPRTGSQFGFFGTQVQLSEPQTQQISIGPKEVIFAQAFLHFLATVVTHSISVRAAIASQPAYRAIPALASLVPLGVPLELKGALFNTLAAFCAPGAGVPGVEICRAVWSSMERLEVINVRANAGPTPGPLPVKGVEVELEEVEAPHRLYPATIPFLRLLTTLLYTPKRVSLRAQVADAVPLNTVPDNLGQPYRAPGIGPYVSFVVDNVLERMPIREFALAVERIEMNSLGLCFVERALASFDLAALVAAVETGPIRTDIVAPLLAHPGYDVLQRILTGTPLQARILAYIIDGADGLEQGLAEEEPVFRMTVVRVLRIVLRVLELQDVFLDVLIPVLSELDGTRRARSHFTRLDSALAFSPQLAPALAAYTAFPAHPELVLLSVKILGALAPSRAFADLPALLTHSADAERILSGYRQILVVESADDVDTSEALAEQTTGAGAPDLDETPNIDQAIRLAALDLLADHTSRGYPTVAHFLLFERNDLAPIQDPHALGARQTCFHIILDLLGAGVPRLHERARAPAAHALFATLPALAERCYRVVYQLCVHPRTSSTTMLYLRTREDFFARQLAAIPAQAPEAPDVQIEVRYEDGARVATTVPALSAFLRLRAWIFDLAALDLHVLTTKGHFKGVTELLGILIGGGYEGDEGDDWEGGVLVPFRAVGQSSLRIIEFVQALRFEWADSLTVTPVELQFFAQLDLLACVRTDAAGCEIMDRDALLALLGSARRSLHVQGRIVTPAQLEQVTAEISYILESCAVENHRREVRHATARGYEAWRRLLDMALTKCFSRLPHDRREIMLFDLLHVLPAALRAPDLAEGTAVLLAEAILSSITKLREDRREQSIVQSAGSDAGASALPAERLYAILRNLLECVLDNNGVELVRGNLYAALTNYLHLIASTDPAPPASSDRNLLSLSTSTMREDFVFGDSRSTASPGPSTRSSDATSGIEAGSLSLLKSVAERLVATVARDAIDGTEVWKTVAFMLLDALVQLSRLERQHAVLSALVRHGILSNFVRGLKESDFALQSVLKPDPDDLNPLYVYEAKMSLFIRMAQTRAGAERLLEAQVLRTLAQCDYLDARPEADQSFMDNDSFLPSAIQRYHQLLMPALQLVNGMLATLGPRHATVANQALDFLSSHRDTIVILLKNDADFVPLALIEEMHLLVTLCGNVLHLVPKSELLSTNSDFGGIHAAILSLSTRCLGNLQWSQNVQPHTDAELLSASVFASGYGSETKFDAAVRQRERLLRKAVIIYIGAASEFTEPEITLVLSPMTTTPRQGSDEKGSRFLATIPTIGDAIEALNDVCNDLADTLKQMSDLSAELSSREQIRVDNIEEIIGGPDAQFLQDLDIRQKRSLICREFERIRDESKNDAKTLLNTMEMLLLLLWRHLAYYAEGHVHHGSQLKASTSHAIRFQAVPEPQAFQEEVGKKIAYTLQRLTSLDLDYESLGSDWRANQGYVEIMCRRLKDSAGLHDSDSLSET